MLKFIRSLAFFASLLAVTVPASCFAANPPIMVFAAASLKDTLEEIGKAYTAGGGAEVRFSFASSALLAKQIEGGNLADLFASADLKWMDYLDDKKLIISETRINLIGNSLVVIAPADSASQKIELNADAILKALGDSRLALADVNTVPAGVYAKSAFQNLGLWTALEPKLAQTDNVRSALAFVAKGEAPLGVVYATDAKVERNVKIVAALPQSSHEPIVYPFAITTSSTNPEVSKFLDFLKGHAARASFEKAGFAILQK